MRVSELDDIERGVLLGAQQPNTGDAANTPASENERLRHAEIYEAQWRYEFRPDEKYPDLGIYTILAPNPDAGKEGVVYSGKELAMADTDDKEVAATIIREHNAHRKLVEALNLVLPLAEQYATRHSAAPEWKRYCVEARVALALAEVPK